MSYVEPKHKKASYTDLYSEEVKFQQLKTQYQDTMMECSPSEPCLKAAHLNVELQNQLGIIASLLDKLKPKQSYQKRQEIIRNLDQLSKDYDEMMKVLNEQKTNELKNTDLEVSANMYHANMLPWGLGAGTVAMLLFWSAI